MPDFLHQQIVPGRSSQHLVDGLAVEHAPINLDLAASCCFHPARVGSVYHIAEGVRVGVPTCGLDGSQESALGSSDINLPKLLA